MKTLILTVVGLMTALGSFGDTWTDPETGIEWFYTVHGESVSLGGGEYSSPPAVQRSTAGALAIPSEIDGKPVTGIGDYAFCGCSGLTSVTIPEGVTSIGDCAFDCCFNVTSVTIPEGVTSIGDSAFNSCTSLTSVTIPEGVTNIGYYAFNSCTSLTSVTIPEGVTSIGDSAFNSCTSLTSVTIPEGVTSIGVCVFYSCSGLTSVTIPSSVTKVEDGAFGDCNRSMRMYFSGKPPVFLSGAGINLSGAGINVDTQIRYNIVNRELWLPVVKECGFLNALAYYPGGQDDIPETVMVEVVDGLVWYYEHPFTASSYAGVVYDPETVMIGYVLTSYSSSVLMTAISTNTVGAVRVPSSLGGCPVTTISDSAFKGCKYVTEIVIPSTVEYIGSSAFDGCSSLLSVKFEGDAPESVDPGVFWRAPKRLVISVPYGSIGWNGITTSLPEAWMGRAIVHEGETYDWDAGHGTSSGGQGQSTSTVTATLNVTNTVIHYIVNSVQPERAIPVTMDTGFVNIITEVKSGGVVSVPETWSQNYPTFTTKYGSDFTKALIKTTGKVDGAGNPMMVWQDYVAGTDPTKEDDVFRASVTMVEGRPVVSYTPELSEAEKALRKYTTWGKVKLQDETWVEIPAGHEADYNFFKVTVEMR